MKQNKDPIMYAEYESAYVALLKAEYMLTVQELMLFINLMDENNMDYEKEIGNRINRLIELKESIINGIKQYTMNIYGISQYLENNLKELIK